MFARKGLDVSALYAIPTVSYQQARKEAIPTREGDYQENEEERMQIPYQESAIKAQLKYNSKARLPRPTSPEKNSSLYNDNNNNKKRDTKTKKCQKIFLQFPN